MNSIWTVLWWAWVSACIGFTSGVLVKECDLSGDPCRAVCQSHGSEALTSDPCICSDGIRFNTVTWTSWQLSP